MSGHKGKLAELRFQLEASKRQIAVSVPIQEKHPYDFIIGIDDRLLKVQLKSRHTENKRMAIKRSKDRTYLLNDFDFLVIYYKKSDDWFMIPFDRFNTFVDLSSEKWLQYKNNWTFCEQ